MKLGVNLQNIKTQGPNVNQTQNMMVKNVTFWNLGTKRKILKSHG